jgi:hypothetical protein
VDLNFRRYAIKAVHEQETIWVVLIAVLMQRGEAELPALLDPTRRQAVGQFLKGQIRRLASIEDRLHNVGSEKCAFQNPAHVPLVETEPLGN